MAWCMQCGASNRPTPAIGVDDEGEPACTGHMVTKKDEQRKVAVMETCYCGRPKGHRGRHIGKKLPDVAKETVESQSQPTGNRQLSKLLADLKARKFVIEEQIAAVELVQGMF